VLVIRDAQMAVFEEAVRREFRRRMESHLLACFPERFAGSAGADLAARIEAALQEARPYGIHAELDCCRFLNLCAALGWEFLREPENAWIGETLMDAGITSVSERLGLVVKRVLHRRQVAAWNRALLEAGG
jgi:hypothetical protein